MKHIIYLTALTVALLICQGQQSAVLGAESATEQEVRQALEKYRTALVNRDAATLEQIWTDDYTFTNGGGRQFRKLSAWPTSNPAQLRSILSTWTRTSRCGFMKTLR